MTRAAENASWRVIEERSPGDMIVEFDVPKITRDKHPDLEIPASFRARAIRYKHGDSNESVLLTSLTDETNSREELVALYHERWEIELAFDEIKALHLARAAKRKSLSTRAEGLSEIPDPPLRAQSGG